MTPRELANEHSRKHNARTTGEDSDAPKKIRELQERIKRLEEQLMDAKNKHAVLVADVVLNEDRAERIKRLEKDSERLAWLLKTGLAWRGCYNDCWIEGTWLYASQYAIATIDKAKEAKL